MVNLDPHNAQSGWLELDLALIGCDAAHAFQVHDLLSDAALPVAGRAQLHRARPAQRAGAVFVVRRRVRDERDFDYFL